MIKILENVSLKDKNTFAVNSLAKYYVEIENQSQVLSLLESSPFQQSKFFILGGGSNTLFVDDYYGIVVHLVNKEIRILESSGDFALLEADSGVVWHDFVQILLANNYFGLENLALIPGTIGGAVTQNVGAYGVELKDFIQEVCGFNIQTGHFVRFSNSDCRFDYRSSIFKNELKGKFIITSAKFKLSKKPNINISYPELRNVVQKIPNIKPNPKNVFEQVISLRKAKLPDPKEFPNAGSFFKNPIVDLVTLDNIKTKYNNVPYFDMGPNKYKIPAGWLIDIAGWKGKRIGNVGTYEKHALVIINFGVKKGSEILEFSKLIQKDVFEKFNVWLENEVELVQ